MVYSLSLSALCDVDHLRVGATQMGDDGMMAPFPEMSAEVDSSVSIGARQRHRKEDKMMILVKKIQGVLSLFKCRLCDTHNNDTRLPNTHTAKAQ